MPSRHRLYELVGGPAAGMDAPTGPNALGQITVASAPTHGWIGDYATVRPTTLIAPDSWHYSEREFGGQFGTVRYYGCDELTEDERHAALWEVLMEAAGAKPC